MESIEKLLQGGLNPEVVMNFLVSAIALFIMLWMKDRIKNLVAWFKFKTSNIVSYNTEVQVGTAGGHKRGYVSPESNRKRIAIDFGDTVRYYTPISFINGDIEVVKPEDKD